MNAKQQKLAREQLDQVLKGFKSCGDIPAPRKGWIRAIRDALGMSGRQLAKRLGVNQQRVARIEQDEAHGRLTINTMQKAAEALNCEFVYGIVPSESLDKIVKKQARKLAAKRISRSNQMMRLEEQELSDEQKRQMLEELTEEIMETMPKSLWDES